MKFTECTLDCHKGIRGKFLLGEERECVYVCVYIFYVCYVFKYFQSIVSTDIFLQTDK